MKKTLSVFLALVLLFSSAAVSAEGISVDAPRSPVGMDISGFSSLDFDQNPVDGSIFQNAALTVLNFWEVGCAPCISEMPYFQQAHEYYSATPEADVQVYTVLYVSSSSTVPDAITILQNYTFGKIIIDSVLTQALLETAIMPGIVGFPETILVDSSGIVRYHHFASYQSYSELNNEIQTWLNQVPPVTPTEPTPADGDVDGNSTVNVADALLCLRASMGLVDFNNDQIAHGDVDGNGSITVADSLTIMRIALGLLS